MKIFVAKLPYQYQEDQINQLFAQYGEVASVNLIMDRETGRSKCYAFVEMPNEDEATNAITNLDQKNVLDKPIAVSQAKERPERAASGGFQQRSTSSGGFQKGGYNKDRGGYGGGNYNKDRGGSGYNKDRGSSGGSYRDRGSRDSSDY